MYLLPVMIFFVFWVFLKFQLTTVLLDKYGIYLQLLKNKQGNDRYAERGMNTFNEPQKCKLVQTSKIGYNVSIFQ